MLPNTDPFQINDKTKWIAHERETWPFRYMTCKVPITLYVPVDSGRPRSTAEEIEKVLPIGTTVKIVMVSRLGDVGITDDLTVDHGYHLRIDLDKLHEMFENPRNEI